MKKFKLILVSLLVVSCSSYQPSRQSSSKISEKKLKKVEQELNAKNYEIKIHTALPMRGKSIQLTSAYSLKIKNDSLFSYLPYYGRAYSIPYGGGAGLIFKAPLESYTIQKGKHEKHIVKASAQTPEDRFDFTLTIFDNGTASVHVNMRNRESISFQGELEQH
ncbi:MAG: DUF4251 domain-containing protein [Bacteroidia bacterium]|nr:DUF4251 domain-containing protein [Bacteroidia bacterium]